MRVFGTVCRVMVWLLLILTAIPQVMAVIGLYIGNSVGLFNPLLLIAATAFMFVAVILFFAMPRGKLIPLLLAAASAVFFVVLAFCLMDIFPVTVTVTKNTGISLWRAIYRHMSPALIPLFMLPLWWDYHTDRRAKALAAADARTPSYFEETETEFAEPHKAKRSVRARNRKSEDNT